MITLTRSKSYNTSPNASLPTLRYATLIQHQMKIAAANEYTKETAAHDNTHILYR